MNRQFIKRTASLLLAVNTFLTAASSSGLELSKVSNAAVILSGDADDDGVVNAADLELLRGYILGEASDISANADLDSNSSVDVFDMIQLRQRLTAEIPENLDALIINEVCSTNKNGIVDAYGKNADWIELYNSSDKDIPLKGIGFSDDNTNPFSYTFPDVTLKAGGYLLVFASKGYESTETELHAQFGISKSGETLYLTHPTEGVIDEMTLPALEEDTAYGHYEDGSGSLAVLVPTPGEANQLPEPTVSAPVFSAESGFYDESFTLHITAGSDCTIYYTTDGSVPTAESEAFGSGKLIYNRSGDGNYLSAKTSATYPDSGYQYQPGEQVAKGHVIKAIAIDSEGRCSEVVTKTYFVGLDQQKRYNSLPVISISIDENDLFDYNTGIYTTGYYYDQFLASGANVKPNEDWLKKANFTQEGREWERPVHVDFFEGDGSLAFSEDLGMRIQGGASRAFLQKSLKFFARSEYGESSLRYELIPDAKDSSGETISKYDKFIIRNGANDNDYAKFRDPMLQELVSDRDFETQQGRPVIAFINGEYWGVYHITEDYSDSYFNEVYGYPKDEVVIIKCGWDLEEGLDSDLEDYHNLIDYVRNTDMSVDSNYSEFCSMVDVQSMADYYAAQIYINNQDVFGETWVNNYRMWKTRTAIDDAEGDGRWRWAAYDFDYSSDVYGVTSLKDLDSLIGAQNENADTVIFAKTFRENEDFRKLFLNTIMDIANENFSQEKVDAAMEKYIALYAPVMTEHIKRFGPDWRVTFISTVYDEKVNDLREFLANRKSVLISGLQSYYGAGSVYDLNVFVNDSDFGSVTINTVTPEIGREGWRGQYFGDIPVTLTANPAVGCTFLGWTGDASSTDATITVTLSEALTLLANFSDGTLPEIPMISN